MKLPLPAPPLIFALHLHLRRGYVINATPFLLCTRKHTRQQTCVCTVLRTPHIDRYRRDGTKAGPTVLDQRATLPKDGPSLTVNGSEGDDESEYSPRYLVQAAIGRAGAQTRRYQRKRKRTWKATAQVAPATAATTARLRKHGEKRDGYAENKVRGDRVRKSGGGDGGTAVVDGTVAVESLGAARQQADFPATPATPAEPAGTAVQIVSPVSAQLVAVHGSYQYGSQISVEEDLQHEFKVSLHIE